MRDHYSILDLKSDCSVDEIKKAYKVLARKWHPDKNPKNQKEAERKFKEISEAYRVLSDPGRRREYDLSRQDPSGGRFTNAATGGSNFSSRHGRGRREYRFDPSFDEEEVYDPSSPLHNKTGNRQRRARFTSSRRQQRPESRSFEQQQTDFSAHFVRPDDLFKEFFGTKDPFESIFNHHDRMFQHHHPGFFEGHKTRVPGAGLSGVSSRNSTAATRKPRSRSLFRDPFLDFGFHASSVFREFDEMDKLFGSLFQPGNRKQGTGIY